MYVFSIIGKKKSGKSVLTRSIVEGFRAQYEGRMYFLDVVDEYTRIYGFKNEFKGYPDHEKFLETVKNVKNSLVVFEEAAYYFSSETNGKTKQAIKRFLQTSRHNNNVVVLIFHSIGDFPSFIYNRIDYLALFKTNDTPNALGKLRNNKQFDECYTSVNEHPSKHYFEVIDVT